LEAVYSIEKKIEEFKLTALDVYVTKNYDDLIIEKIFTQWSDIFGKIINNTVENSDDSCEAQKLIKEFYLFKEEIITEKRKLMGKRLHKRQTFKGIREETIPRLTPYKALQLPHTLTPEEVAMQLQAAMTNNAIALRQIFWRTTDAICRSLIGISEIIRATITTNPTMSMRNLLKNQFLYARSGGEYVEIWPCTPIKEVTFLPMKDKCTQDIPIKYQFKNKSYNGYLNPVNNIIQSDSMPVSCEMVTELPFMWNKTGKLYQSVNGATYDITNPNQIEVFEWKFQNMSYPELPVVHPFSMYHLNETTHPLMFALINERHARLELVAKELGILLDSPDGGSFDPAESARNAVETMFGKGVFGFLF